MFATNIDMIERNIKNIFYTAWNTIAYGNMNKLFESIHNGHYITMSAYDYILDAVKK